MSGFGAAGPQKGGELEAKAEPKSGGTENADPRLGPEVPAAAAKSRIPGLKDRQGSEGDLPRNVDAGRFRKRPRA